MPAGDFSDSVISRAQVELAKIFASPNTSGTEMLEGTAATARAVLENQRARTEPRLEGNKIIGVSAWFLRPNADDSANTTTPTTCATPTGEEAETISANYDTTILVEAAAKVQDNRSDNWVIFEQEMAAQMAYMMAKMRKDLNNTVIIPGLTAASQTNLDTFMNSTWDGMSADPRIIVPLEDFKWENLNEFGIVAENNNFRDFFWVSGRLFNDSKWLAMLNSTNEGERAAARAWAAQEIYFDVRDLDKTMTRRTAFAIERNSYAFWNTYRSTSAPKRIPVADGEKWVWIEADPVLRYRKNGVLVPVQYEMEMAITCVGRDDHAFTQNQYLLYGRLLGGFETVPEGRNGELGVLQFSNE
jgi:hypothetical protein